MGNFMPHNYTAQSHQQKIGKQEED